MWDAAGLAQRQREVNWYLLLSSPTFDAWSWRGLRTNSHHALGEILNSLEDCFVAKRCSYRWDVAHEWISFRCHVLHRYGIQAGLQERRRCPSHQRSSRSPSCVTEVVHQVMGRHVWRNAPQIRFGTIFSDGDCCWTLHRNDTHKWLKGIVFDIIGSSPTRQSLVHRGDIDPETEW